MPQRLKWPAEAQRLMLHKLQSRRQLKQAMEQAKPAGDAKPVDAKPAEDAKPKTDAPAEK